MNSIGGTGGRHRASEVSEEDCTVCVRDRTMSPVERAANPIDGAAQLCPKHEKVWNLAAKSIGKFREQRGKGGII